MIPVHSAARPIERAVNSALAGGVADTRVIVVAHNIDPDRIRAALGEAAGDSRVEVIGFSDGISSPAGPRNHGIGLATAPYLCFVDSDDYLLPGALASWLALAESSSARAVMPRIEREGADGADPLPPTRPGRTTDLDPKRDRLAYRSEPVGLLSTAEFGGVRFTEGLASGEDLEVSSSIWFSGKSIAYDRTGPAYVYGADAGDRVTADTRSVTEDFAFLEAIAGAAWFHRLSRSAKRAIGVKLFRLHFFDAVLARLEPASEFAEQRAGLRTVAERIEAMAPGSLALLSRRDRQAIDAATLGDATPEEVRALLEARWLGGVDAILTRNPLLALHPQGPRATMRAMTV